MTPAAGFQRASIRTRRLELAPVAECHAPALFPLLNDWEVVRMLARVPWPLAREDVEAWAARSASPISESDDFTVLAEGEPIGVVSLKRPGTGEPPRVMPRLGYWTGRKHWGRGYATESVGALVAHAFRAFGAERVGAGVFADNPTSCRVLEKLGFREMGRYETDCLARGGRVGTIDMQVTRSAFQGARA